MNIRQLETFVAIAQLGSFSAVASRLNASQSTISARIQELEQTLGVALFDRRQRAVRLTLKGRELLPHAQHAVSAFAEIRQRISGSEALSGLIRIGVAEVVAISWLPDFITTVHELHPGLSLELHVLLTSEILGGLEAGDLDMALIPGSRFASTLTAVSMGSVRFTWMAGSNFQAVDRAMTPRDLRQYRIFSLGKNSYHNQTMQEWLYADEGSLLRVDTCNSMSIIASLTAAGLGISLLPEQFYQNAIQNGQLKPIMTKPDIPLVEFSAVYPRVPPNTAQRCLSELAVQVSTFQALASHGEAIDANLSGAPLSSDMDDARP
jgi:DNA-binding transcriptional LysR family regulator